MKNTKKIESIDDVGLLLPHLISFYLTMISKQWQSIVV